MKRGDVIAKVGRTGTTYFHLHFEIARDATGSYAVHAGQTNRRVDPYAIEDIAAFYPPPGSNCSNVKRLVDYLWTACPLTSTGPQFDFAVDFLSVAGNVNGGAGFFDDFNDGSLTTPPTSNIVCNQNTAPVSESGGFLHLSSADGANTFSPGFLVDNCILGQDAPAFRLNDGSGNSVITASFRADVPGPGQGAGLQLFTFGTNTNETVNINFSTGPFVVAVSQPANGPQSVQAVPIDLTGVQRVMLRLTFNDATNEVTHSFSLNGGATFTDIPLPQPGRVMTTGSQATVSVFGSVQLPTSP